MRRQSLKSKIEKSFFFALNANVQAIFDNYFSDFKDHPKLKSHVGLEAFHALAKNPNQLLLIDTTVGKRYIKAGLLLSLALICAEHFKKQFLSKRVGVVLPPGLGGFVANLGLFLADKVPVNFNFTAPQAHILSAIHQSGVDAIITAKTMEAKLPHFPWSAVHIFDIANFLGRLPKLKVIKHLACIYLLPVAFLKYLWLSFKKGGSNEAALLFTSGSEGDIKGVPLTHANLIGNALQISSLSILSAKERVMACLPLFHSFGFTVTLVYPLLYPLTVVTTPSPLEIKKIAHLIDEEQITVHLGTPTFFRPYLKAADPHLLRYLKAIIAGAEKTPDGLANAWEERFGSLYLEGYGLTETTPVVAVNLPSLSPGEIRSRKGTVGKLLPGMAARVVNPETREPLPLGQSGILELKGINVFEGYLNNPERTASAFNNGWFHTHDLASISPDGFLTIEGRLARFSKIGGEMVSHAAIEGALMEAYQLEKEAILPWAITAIPDAHKGEALVLITTLAIDSAELHQRLHSLGLPNLWIPKHFVQVESLPCLASGKLDIKACRSLALAAYS